MTRPFSETVTSAEWRRDAEAWISDEMAQRGRALSGAIEQPRVRPWSTQLRVPTDAGVLWFKALCPAAQFEPRLQAEMARLAPDLVDDPFAIDEQRGWMITVDRGQTLGDSRGDAGSTSDDWVRVVAETAHLQQLLADHGDELLAAGLPDCTPDTVPDRFDRLLEVMSSLPADHPAHVDADSRQRLAARRSELVDAADLLTSAVLPPSLQHGDVHPWNVFVVEQADGEHLRLFDFGDAQWAHVTEALSVPYGWVQNEGLFPWEPLLDSYCDAWDVSRVDVEAMFAAAAFTHPINRALTWWGCLDAATAAEWEEWGEAPIHHLKRLLDA